MAAGDEVLIVDSTRAHREGMRKLFEEAGYVVTAVGTIAEAHDFVGAKFFPAALVDLDVERVGAGLDVVRFVRERSESTAVVLLTGRRSFEAAVEALRLGVTDIVVKRPDAIGHLKNAIELACDRFHAREGGETDIWRDTQKVLDTSFKIMLELARHYYHDLSVAVEANFKPRILVVDSDSDMLQELAKLVEGKQWQIGAEMTGGAALEKTSGEDFDIVAARDELIDLRGSMVVKTIQARRTETVGLVYTAPGGEGRIDLYRDGQMDDSERPFKGAAQLVERLSGLSDTLGATQRDRRIIQAFRNDHQDYFRRYAELKIHIDRVLDG